MLKSFGFKNGMFSIRLIFVISLLVLTSCATNDIQPPSSSKDSSTKTKVGTSPLLKDGKYNCKLTFDDGPVDNDLRILQILDKYNVKATFFFIGEKMKKRPDIVRKVQADGHKVAAHSWSHLQATRISPAQQKQEIDRVIEEFSKQNLKADLYRPPFGDITDYQKNVLKGYGIDFVKWNLDTKDWQAMNASSIVNAVATKPVYHNTNILMHSTSNHMVKALEDVIKTLNNRGCYFTKL